MKALYFTAAVFFAGHAVADDLYSKIQDIRQRVAAGETVQRPAYNANYRARTIKTRSFVDIFTHPSLGDLFFRIIHQGCVKDLRSTLVLIDFQCCEAKGRKLS